MIDSPVPLPEDAKDFQAPIRTDHIDPSGLQQPHSTKIYDLQTGTWQSNPPNNESPPAESETPLAISPEDFSDLDQQPLSVEKLSNNLDVRQTHLEQRLLTDLALQEPEAIRRTLISYELNGGDVITLSQKHPESAELQLAIQQYQDIQKNASDYAARMQADYQTYDLTFPEHQQTLERNVRQYAALNHDPSELMPDDLRQELQKSKPELVAAFDEIRLRISQENKVKSIHQQYELIDAVLNNPDMDQAARQRATVMATEIISINAQQLTEIGFQDSPDDPEFSQLHKKMAEWGVDAATLNETINELETDAETHAKKETLPGQIDVLSVFNLRDKDGNIVKGKARTFAIIAGLVVLSDQFFGGLSGQGPLLPALMGSITSIGNELVQEKYMADLKIKDPATYAYYQRMGYGSNFITKWLMDFLKNKAQDYVARKAA